MIDPGKLKRILAILKYEASRKGGSYDSGATPEQRRAYFDDLLSAGESSESQAKRSPWKSPVPQHGFRGTTEDRESAPPPALEGRDRLNRALQLVGEDIADVGGQFGGAAAQVGVRLPEGGLRLIGQEGAADKLEDVRDAIAKSVGPAESKAGAVAGMAGTVAPFVAGSMGAGSLASMLLRGAAMDVPAEASGRDFSVLGMVADWRKKKAEEEGRDLTQFEEHLEAGAENPWARGVTGGMVGGAAGMVGELMPGARAARKATREADEAKWLERNTPPLPPLMKDVDQAALDKVMRQRGRENVTLSEYKGPERRAPSRMESRMPEEMDIPPNPRRGAVDPAILKGVVRTGVGAVGGSAAASGEGGLTPTEGALIGAGVVNIPALMRARRGAKAVVPDVVKGEKAAQHPTLISDLKPKVEDDYDVTISALADSPEGVPEVVARAERLKPDLEPKYTRGKAERVALAEQVPLEDVLAKPAGEPLNDVGNEVLRLNYNKNKTELTDLYEKSATAIDAVEAAEISKRIDELEAVQDQIVLKRVPTASEAGRALASLRADFAAGSPLAWIQKSERIIGRSLTTAEKEEINALVKAGKFREASQYVQDTLKPLTPKDIEFWTTFRKGSLLSAGVSVGRAVFGNTANVGFNAASRPATVTLDVLASIIRTGSPVAARSTSVRGTGRQLFEGLKGAASGIPEGGRIMLSGLDDAAAAKLELRKGSRLKSPLGFDVPESVRSRMPKGFQPKRVDAVDIWTQFWLRAQGAVDRPFRNATIRASNAELAELIAGREGLKGSQKRARVKHLIANPTAEMGILSNLRADHISFQGDSFLTDIGAKLKQSAAGSDKVGTRSVARHPAIRGTVEMIQPFTRTPGAIVQQNIEATPFGLVGFGMDARRLAKAVSAGDEKLATEIQRRMASRGGRAITGSVIGIWLGGKWYSEGKMLATPPEGGSERTQFFDEGKTPFSLLVNNRWVSLAQLGPLGASVSFGAVLAKMAEEEGKTVAQLATDPIQKAMSGDVAGATKDVASAAGTLGAGAAQTTAQLALETPFLTGTKEVLDALRDPQGTFGEKAINSAASFVPNLSASRARATDPVVRNPEGLTQTVKTRIPGQSQDVAPALMAASGEPKLREAPGTEQAWWQAVLGSSPDRTKIEPILAEMESVGAAVGKISKGDDETDEMYFKRQQFAGDMVQLAVTAMVNPAENPTVLRDMGLDASVTVQGRRLTLPEVYRIAKARPRNDPDMKLILQALGEAPGFPADMENAGDILEYAISKARGFATKQLRNAGIR